MKATKKVLAILMCLCLIVSCVALSAVAAGTASITVENQSGTNATVAGKTLNLFKIFNATRSGDNISYQWVTETDGSNRYEDFFFGTDGVTGKTEGTIHDAVEYINSLKDDSFAFSSMAAKLHNYIHDNTIGHTATSGEIGDVTSYTFDGLDLGYYLIYDATDLPDNSPAVRSAAMLTHAGENKTIQLKADRPHVEKTVDDSDDDTPVWKLSTTASVGDTVTFRIVTMVPDHTLYEDGKYVFEISDSMSDHLELLPDTIKVTITEPAAVEGGEQAHVQQPTILTDPDDLEDGEDFKVIISDITDLQKDSVVEIIYDAKVLKTAEFKNPNTVTLTYSNDPHDVTSTGSVSSTANVLLWQFTLTKYMEDAGGSASAIRLGGAEFEIFAKGSDDPLKFTAVPVDGADYVKYVYDPTGGNVTTLATVNEGDDGKTDVGYTDGGYLGQILIFGLGEGNYVIRETKAPDGYQIAKGDFEFSIVDEIGTIGAISNATITETRTETPGKFTRVMIEESSQKYYVGITNAPGSALPETGGMGTTLFTILGIVLMAGAIAFFTSRKRSSAA